LKGSCQADIDIDQAPSSGLVGFAPSCGQGDAMLLFLKRDGQGFLSVPPTYEIFLPKATPPPDTLTGNCYSRVISYLLFAMSDPTYGSFASRFLERVFDPALIDKIKPFATNSDRDVRGEALYFLAHNQDVEAIPLVRKAQEEAESQNWFLAAPGGLANYVLPSALPLLNPTLFSTSWEVRLNAETSIIRIHSSTSIPYLMVALYDPEKQNIVAYRAYYELSKYMGFHPISWAQFDRNRAKADIPVFNWWRAELLGKHVRASQATAIVGTASPEASPSERLFNSDIRIRQAEMSALEKGATADDVPYLMLALHDPDADLSYRAYKTLFALLKLRSEMASETSFIASPDLTTQPIYIWWQNHFVDN